MWRCLFNHVTRHVASTWGQSMTNGAHYKWGQLHHSSWHSDIHTPNQLNTPPEWRSPLFQTKHCKQRWWESNQTAWISLKEMCPTDLHSDSIPDAIPSSITNLVTIPETMSDCTEANSKAISDHSHCSTVLQECGRWQWLCEAVGEHLNSRYVV